MSQIQVDNIYNKEATGSPNFPLGANVTGVITATSYSGSGANLTGIDATALKDSNGTVRVQANTTGAVITGNVSVGGTLTYEDVTNVDAVGVITARSGIKVTTGGIDIDGGGIDITGNIGLGGATYGTAGQVLTSGGSGANATWTTVEASPTISGISSGTIANGSPVVLFDDGKFGAVSGSPGTNGTPANVFNVGTTSNYTMTYDTTNDKYVAFYVGTSGWLYCKVGTLSGTTITWGSEVMAWGNGTSVINSTFDPVAGKVVCCFQDSGDSYKGKAIVGTISGGNITFGSPSIFANGNSDNISCCFCSTINKILIAFRDNDDSSQIKSVVGSISGTQVGNYGSEVACSQGNQGTGSRKMTKVVWDPTAQKAILAYSDYSNTEAGAVRTLTISGNTITVNTRQWFDSSRVDHFIDMAYDSANSQAVIFWREGSNGTGYYNLARTAKPNGNNIDLGTQTYTVVQNQGGQGCIEYDPSANKFLLCYVNQTNTNYSETSIMTLTGSVMSFSTPYNFHSTDGSQDGPQFMVYDPDAGAMSILYRNNPGNGCDYFVQKIRVSNATADNFMGFSKAAYTNGQTAKVSVIGATSTNQTGLTTAAQYYVQGDGTLASSADSANISAGKALSYTDLLVKG